MSITGVGALCKCGGRSRIRSLTVEPTRRILKNRERSLGHGGVQVEAKRSIMILNPAGRNIRGNNMSAPPPPKQIAPEEDKVAQVLKIIQNLELQKSNISPAQENKVVEKIVAAPEIMEKETVAEPENVSAAPEVIEKVAVAEPEEVVAAPEIIEKETDTEQKIEAIVDTILQAEPEKKSTVSVDDKAAIEAIVETARNQDAAVDNIVKESTAEHINEKAEEIAVAASTSQDDEVKPAEEIKSESSPESNQETPEVEISAASAASETVEVKVEPDTPAENPNAATVIQSENKKFSMSITSAVEPELDSSSSDSDSDSSSSSSSSSDSDVPAQNTVTPTPTIGKTQLDKFLSGPGYATVAPHKPLIKFRKSGKINGIEVPAIEQPIISPPKVENVIKATLSDAKTSLEWWQIPAKYRRANIQDLEIEQINSGGAEVMFK